jgi:hypothetical protein
MEGGLVSLMSVAPGVEGNLSAHIYHTFIENLLFLINQIIPDD